MDDKFVNDWKEMALDQVTDTPAEDDLPEADEEREHRAAVDRAIANSPVRSGDWVGEILRNREVVRLGHLTRAQTGSLNLGGAVPPTMISRAQRPDWSDVELRAPDYVPKPASGFTVASKRRRLTKDEMAERSAAMSTQQQLGKIAETVRGFLGEKPTPQRDVRIGQALLAAQALLDRGEFDPWVATIPLSRSGARRFMGGVKMNNCSST